MKMIWDCLAARTEELESRETMRSRNESCFVVGSVRGSGMERVHLVCVIVFRCVRKGFLEQVCWASMSTVASSHDGLLRRRPLRLRRIPRHQASF